VVEVEEEGGGGLPSEGRGVEDDRDGALYARPRRFHCLDRGKDCRWTSAPLFRALRPEYPSRRSEGLQQSCRCCT
jgi:hypothetical protein